MKRTLFAAAILAAAITPASAYTTYLKPEHFWPTDSHVAIEGSYANQFFTPQVAVPGNIRLIEPSGAPGFFNSIAVQGAATDVDANLPGGGTYRISTGEQLGPVATLVGEDGQWRQLATGEIPPEGAETTTLQPVTLADVYVTRGAPTRTVVDTAMGRLAIHPITHPNQVLAANGLQIEVLFDGAPLENMAVVLYGAGDPDTKLDRFFVTGADGRTTIAVDAPGAYVIAARHRADAPAGAEAAVRSYTTTLTFEALSALPRIVPVPEPRPERRRRSR